jgi:hypothetical protein
VAAVAGVALAPMAKSKKKSPAKAKPKAVAKSKASAKKRTGDEQTNHNGQPVGGKLAKHEFLKAMYADTYFPKKAVDKVKRVLVALCAEIEKARPANLEALYKLTHAATDKINDLQDDFFDADSEIETVGREIIAEEFVTIATTYGFKDADIEELIATRDW